MANGIGLDRCQRAKTRLVEPKSLLTELARPFTSSQRPPAKRDLSSSRVDSASMHRSLDSAAAVILIIPGLTSDFAFPEAANICG